MYNHPRGADYIPAYKDSMTDLTVEQQAAFDALNTLQTSSDEVSRLYSSFPGIIQPFYPPDTIVVISQQDFQTAMELFVNKHYTNLPAHQQTELARASVRAQDEYHVLWCNEGSGEVILDDGIPYDGVWVFPNILGRRDLILEW